MLASLEHKVHISVSDYLHTYVDPSSHLYYGTIYHFYSLHLWQRCYRTILRVLTNKCQVFSQDFLISEKNHVT